MNILLVAAQGAFEFMTAPWMLPFTVTALVVESIVLVTDKEE